jgi:hypothetical protein
MVSNTLRNAAIEFRTAMTAVGDARDRLANAVAAEAEAPDPQLRTRDERDALLQLRNRLRGGELPEILGATRLLNLEGVK